MPELEEAGPKEVAFNAIGWYVLALIPLIYLAIKVIWVLIPLAIAGMLEAALRLPWPRLVALMTIMATVRLGLE